MGAFPYSECRNAGEGSPDIGDDDGGDCEDCLHPGDDRSAESGNDGDPLRRTGLHDGHDAHEASVQPQAEHAAGRAARQARDGFSAPVCRLCGAVPCADSDQLPAVSAGGRGQRPDGRCDVGQAAAEVRQAAAHQFLRLCDGHALQRADGHLVGGAADGRRADCGRGGPGCAVASHRGAVSAHLGSGNPDRRAGEPVSCVYAVQGLLPPGGVWLLARHRRGGAGAGAQSPAVSRPKDGAGRADAGLWWPAAGAERGAFTDGRHHPGHRAHALLHHGHQPRRRHGAGRGADLLGLPDRLQSAPVRYPQTLGFARGVCCGASARLGGAVHRRAGL